MNRCLLVPLLLSAIVLSVELGPISAAAQQPAYLTQWGTPGSGNGRFVDPIGMAVDQGDEVYVAERGNQRIQKFTSDGTYLTQWGTSGSGNGEFSSPFGVAVDGHGYVYVADQWNNRIQKFTSDGAYVTQWGTYGSGDGQFSYPMRVALDGRGNIYVTDHDNHRVQKFASDGTYVTQWGTYGSGNGQFNYPVGVLVGRDGRIYVTDSANHRIQVFTSDGVYLAQWGTYGSGDGQFQYPWAVAQDAQGNLYVADDWNHRIQVFTSDGAYLTQWGTLGAADGQFYQPLDVTVDRSGNSYVVDYGNNRVQKFGPLFGVQVAFDFMPQTLNLKSNGRWVTGYLRPPTSYLASQIDVSSIRLNGTVPASSGFRPVIEDGDTKLTVKFAREEVEATLAPGPQVVVAVTGTIAGRQFTGTDSITVIAPKTRALLANATVAPASIVNLTWDAQGQISAGSIALLSSLDDGWTWAVEVDGLPVSGSFAWTATDVAVERAQLVLGVIHGADETGPVLAAEIEVSDPFSITAAAGVGAGRAGLALRPENPAVGSSTVHFSLPGGAHATLEIHDVGGRLVVEREVGSAGPGWHTARMGELPSGLYFVRLTQAGHSLSSRIAVLH